MRNFDDSKEGGEPAMSAEREAGAPPTREAHQLQDDQNSTAGQHAAQARRIARFKALVGPEVFERMQQSGRSSFGPFAMADTPPPSARKEPLDITNRSSSMPRDSSILYRNEDPKGSDPCHYRGLMRDATGELFWIRAWVRIVKDKRVLEIRKTPKN